MMHHMSRRLIQREVAPTGAKRFSKAKDANGGTAGTQSAANMPIATTTAKTKGPGPVMKAVMFVNEFSSVVKLGVLSLATVGFGTGYIVSSLKDFKAQLDAVQGQIRNAEVQILHEKEMRELSIQREKEMREASELGVNAILELIFHPNVPLLKETIQKRKT